MSQYISDHTVAELELAIANGLAGGSPKGTYADLAALAAAIPVGNTNIYITLDNGYWNYWNGTAWTAGAMYTNNTEVAGKADKSNTYTKAEVDNKVSAVYRFKGNVTTYANLPTENLVIGDVYNVTDTGINYAWTGTVWDDIGGVEALATASNNGLMSKEDFAKLASITVANLLTKASIINNLTTGGTQSPLSAEMGKSLSTSITELNADVDFNVTNLVVGGDFNSGYTGWVNEGCTRAAANNTLTLTGDGTRAIPDVYTSIGAKVVGHKYYATAKMRVTNTSCTQLRLVSDAPFASVTNPVQNQWYTFNGLVTATTTANLLVLYQTYADAATANGKVMEVQYVLAIDLTAAFGAGNEPTAAEVDAILAFYPNSWFNGTVNLASNPKMLPYLLNTLRSKANIAQEAWITPTLLNGWTTSAGAELKYRKDSLGKVHLSGKVLTGTQGTVIAVLPSGYRPLHQLTIFVANNAYNNILLNVATNGNLIAYGTYTGYVSFDNVSFYIDA